ncbi:hypothetical protein NQ317_008463 [Molorchus minor]|uniref:Cytochrome P450 n=1 Tax=Molorchus minor TaxID=1323400 RepID=A0ABQ9JE64_9CUCU|nr:hypothetical protein NQ317_008463 [Molorchus minor]
MNMLITSLWSIDLLLLFILITFLLHKYVTRHFDYWQKRGSALKQILGIFFKEIYDGACQPFFGVFIFDEPYLVLKSPELIKQVLISTRPTTQSNFIWHDFLSKKVQNGELTEQN